jgi:hypothetical protein
VCILSLMLTIIPPNTAAAIGARHALLSKAILRSA